MSSSVGIILPNWMEGHNPFMFQTTKLFFKVTLKTIYSRRKFRNQTFDNMDRWKAEQGRGREKGKIRRKKSKKKEDADAWKGRIVAKHCVFPMIWGSGGSSSRLAKAAGAEPAGQMRDEKVHAVVARSTFPSQNVQNTPGSDHFWKLRCRKSARRCGAKHNGESKCTKHTRSGPLLEVQMSLRVAGARDCAPCQKWAKHDVLKHFQLQPPLHHTTVQYITLHYNYNYTFTTFYYTTLHYTTLHSITLNYTTLHSTTLHYITLHYITVHYTSLHCTTLHSTTIQLQLHNYTPLHFTTINYTTLHYTTLHSTTLHYITLLHYTTFHYTSLHYTTLHSTTLQLQLQLQLHSTIFHDTKLHYTTTLYYITLHFTTLHYTTLHDTTLHYTEWHCTTDRQVDR